MAGDERTYESERQNERKMKKKKLNTPWRKKK